MPRRAAATRPVTRTQTGFRIETRLLKVLKGLAEALDLSLGDLVEGVLLHAFEGRAPFSPGTLGTIAQLKKVYGLDLTAADSHRLREAPGPAASRRASPPRAGGRGTRRH
ncbi:MAG: hypothetical protein R2752_16645 [Vicinamibacterales bacterium]